MFTYFFLQIKFHITIQSRRLIKLIKILEIIIFFIEEFLTLKIFFKILYLWLLNCYKFKKNKNKIKSCFLNHGIVDWKLIEDEIEESFFGTSSLINIYYFYYLKKLSKKIEKIDKTFFYTKIRVGKNHSFII